MDRNRHYCSFVGHCYIADDRIIKVSKKFENGCCLNVFIEQWDPMTLYPECINKKTSTASRSREMGAKSLLLCCDDNEPYTLLLFCTMFKQGERIFLLSVSRCGISRRQAHVRWVTRWEAVILNYECSIRRVFPV